MICLSSKQAFCIQVIICIQMELCTHVSLMSYSGPVSEWDEYYSEMEASLDSLMTAQYHNYNALTKELKSIHNQWPGLTKLYHLNPKSVQNRNIWVLQISTDLTKNKRAKLKPMVKYIGNIHGNEAVGRELLIQFSKYLLNSYNSYGSSKEHARIRKLLETTDIHILPSMNPDGFESSREIDCDSTQGINYVMK